MIGRLWGDEARTRALYQVFPSESNLFPMDFCCIALWNRRLFSRVLVVTRNAIGEQ
jgi:hypothetical protein